MNVENVGQPYSTSLNACWIRFSGGGPYNGKQGLFDCDTYDSIGVSDSEKRMSWSYRRAGRQHYTLDSVHCWGSKS